MEKIVSFSLLALSSLISSHSAPFLFSRAQKKKKNAPSAEMKTAGIVGSGAPPALAMMISGCPAASSKMIAAEAPAAAAARTLASKEQGGDGRGGPKLGGGGGGKALFRGKSSSVASANPPRPPLAPSLGGGGGGDLSIRAIHVAPAGTASRDGGASCPPPPCGAQPSSGVATTSRPASPAGGSRGPKSAGMSWMASKVTLPFCCLVVLLMEGLEGGERVVSGGGDESEGRKKEG